MWRGRGWSVGFFSRPSEEGRRWPPLPASDARACTNMRAGSGRRGGGARGGGGRAGFCRTGHRPARVEVLCVCVCAPRPRPRPTLFPHSQLPDITMGVTQHSPLPPTQTHRVLGVRAKRGRDEQQRNGAPHYASGVGEAHKLGWGNRVARTTLGRVPRRTGRVKDEGGCVGRAGERGPTFRVCSQVGEVFVLACCLFCKCPAQTHETPPRVCTVSA